MNRAAHSCTRQFVTAAVIGALTLMAMPRLTAQADDAPRGVWLASAGSEKAPARWGRLTLRDGVLAFASPTSEWQLAASEIKRAAISEQSDRVMVVEASSGQTYYVTILGQQMLAESPRRALQVIQKALRSPASRRE